MTWTEGELVTLAEVAESFVRGAASRRAALAATALEAGADPDQLRRLRLALRLFQSPPANLVLSGRAVRFGDLDPAARERYLLGWAGSRFGLRRSAFQALKRLLCFLAYADPGPDGAGGHPNFHWAALGYVPAVEPLTGEPSPIQAAPLPAAEAGVVELSADVVVVGSGAGGGVVAAELARAGRSVIVLEAGALVTEPEMPTNELAGFDRLYLDRGTTASADASISILAGATVGGGTVVNWASCMAPPESLRREWTRDHGLEGFDGPEMEVDLEALTGELGFLEGPAVPPKDAVIARGARALGYEAGLTRRDAVGCGDCGSCGFGCRRGAKRSGLRVHLAEAWRAGARIVPGAQVRRVLREGNRAVGVEARIGEGVLRVRAAQVVVSAGTLRTPAVLERSGIAHRVLGRYLRLHPVPVIAARFAEPIDMWRGTMQAVRSVEFLEPVADRGGFVVESAPGHPGLVALALPWEGTDPHAALMERAANVAPLIGVCRDHDGGRVSLTRNDRVRIDYRLSEGDATTLRRALKEMARIGRAAGAVELLALGTPAARHATEDAGATGEEHAFGRFLERLEHFDFGSCRGLVFSAHQMGTARMGWDPARYVCDPHGRVRSGDRPGTGVVRGLYVADASLFPTSLGLNPMVTVMLLARRVARTVLVEG